MKDDNDNLADWRTLTCTCEEGANLHACTFERETRHGPKTAIAPCLFRTMSYHSFRHSGFKMRDSKGLVRKLEGTYLLLFGTKHFFLETSQIHLTRLIIIKVRSGMTR